LCTSCSQNASPIGWHFYFAYSRANASTGSSLAALRAGNQPNKIPVKVEHKNAVISAIGEKPISHPGKNSCNVNAINSAPRRITA
jgi:hypothetical protein